VVTTTTAVAALGTVVASIAVLTAWAVVSQLSGFGRTAASDNPGPGDAP
jgi:hypothetical protein